MAENPQSAFVFGTDRPRHLLIYASLKDAASSLKSLDVTGEEEAFTESSQVVRVRPTSDLFATFEVSDENREERLRELLRQVPGPQRLADQPAAYALEWRGGTKPPRGDCRSCRRSSALVAGQGACQRGTRR